MPAEIRKKKEKMQPKPKPTVKFGGHGNDPYVIKKVEASRAFLEKHGFPEELLKKK